MNSRTRTARVTVFLKPAVLDPAGRAIAHALHGLGFDGVDDVRVGKVIELRVTEGTTKEQLTEMAQKLLANPVIENFEISLS